jgi:NAD-dependent dihydropyrimidine dehydrogenase PreA subunit
VRIGDVPHYLRDTLLRLFPHRAPTGLYRIGSPDRSSPVLLTGNFTLTVRRLRDVLNGFDAWLLVANSNGINVWCAAGGGHLTHHDVISVLRTSGIADCVDHRELMLPQLAATGVERRPIEDATGWSTLWGPARLEDLPAVLRRGGSVRGRERTATFPLRERIEMAWIWIPTMALVLGSLSLLIDGWLAMVAVVTSLVVAVMGLFACIPRVPITGGVRWVTFFAAALLGAAIGGAVLVSFGARTAPGQVVVILSSVLGMVILSVDITGTTPLYPGSVNSRGGTPDITLDVERCSGAADCVQVCPSAVLRLAENPARAVIAAPGACIACAACIVQCPEDALTFTYPDGRMVEPATIRRTRLNLIGDRTVQVSS